MGVQHIPGNIYRIRKTRDITMKDIANTCGISRVAYSNIENGKSQPKSSTLISISQALDVDLKELLADPPTFKSLRFRSSRSLTNKEKNLRQEIIYDVSRWLKDYNELESLLNYPKAKELVVGSANPKEAAYEMRESVGLEPDKPINDIIGLLGKRIGLKFYLSSFELRKFFGFSVGVEDGGPAIIVNVADSISIERRIFTVAHELAHLLLHKPSFNQNEVEENEIEEKEANLFAGHFLLPQEGFDRELEEAKGLHWIDAVLHIKRKFKVSYKTVIQRLIELGYAEASKIYPQFTQAIWEKFKISLKSHYEPYPISEEESAEPDPLSTNDFVEDRLKKLVREAYEREQISLSRSAEILRLSLSEMRELNNGWQAIG